MENSTGKILKTVTIKHKQGLHLSPASIFAEKARQFNAEILVYPKDDNTDKWNGKRVIELMSIGAVCDSDLVIEAEGDDAETAVTSLADLVENNFGLK